VPFVGRAGMDLATALASSSEQKKSQYVFFHNASVPPGPNTNECFELFNQLISKGERCIYVDTSLANIPSIIPVGDRITKVWIGIWNLDALACWLNMLNTFSSSSRLWPTRTTSKKLRARFTLALCAWKARYLQTNQQK
jgi:hypothetical protein